VKGEGELCIKEKSEGGTGLFGGVKGKSETREEWIGGGIVEGRGICGKPYEFLCGGGGEIA